jgi:hypothetical protein
MPAETVQIDDLFLRVQGLSVGEARSLGEDVVQRVADAVLVDGRAAHLGALELRVTVPYGTSQDQLVQMIADRILSVVR